MEHNLTSRLRSLGLSGILASTVLWSMPAHGAEVILFQYKDTEVEVSRQELESLSETGQLPSVFRTLLGDSIQAPDSIQKLLTRQIKVPSSLRAFLSSTIGEFAIEQLDQVIISSSSKKAQRVTFLKSAFNSAFTDQGLSFIDIVRQYPEAKVQVNVTNLERTYNQVVDFIEKSKPALETAKSFIGPMICNCNRAQSSESSMPNTPSGVVNASFNQPCLKSENSTETTAQILH